MPYPKINTNRLRLRLGKVATGAIANGSHSLNAGLGFTAADIGCPITVYGGVPLGILVTTVTAVADPSHCTLANAASADVLAISPNVTLYRAVSFMTGTLRWQGSIVSKGALDFSLLTLPSGRPKAGTPVILTLVTGGVEDLVTPLFGGRVETNNRSNVPGTSFVRSDCGCSNWTTVLTDRRTGLRTYTSPTTCGQAVQDLNLNVLNQEFFSTSVQPGATIDTITFDYDNTVAEAISKLAQLSSNEIDTYFFWVSAWRVIHFELQTTVVAPWGVSDGDGSDINMDIQVSVNETLDKLANRVFVKSSKALTAPDTFTFNGDGFSREFILPTVMVKMPGVTVDTVPKTVGLLGTTGFDWYWDNGSNMLTQDPFGPLLDGTNTIVVAFQTYTDALVLYQYNAAVDARSAIEGGTGYHETVVVVNEETTEAQMAVLAEAIAHKSGSSTNSILIRSPRPGIMPGALFTIQSADIDVNGSFPVDSVTLTTVENYLSWEISIIGSPLHGDWRRAFADLANQDVEIASGIGSLVIPTPKVPAPNVTSTCAPVYFMVAGASYYQWAGTITLPTTNANYPHLSAIEVWGFSPGSNSGRKLAVIPRDKFGVSSVTWTGLSAAQPLTDSNWSFRFLAYNEAGEPTASPYTIASVTLAGSFVSGYTSVVDSHTYEILPEHKDVRLLSTRIDYVPILNGNIVPQNVTLWITSTRDPAKFTYIGWSLMGAVGQVLSVWRLVPGANTNWKIYCLAGSNGGDATVDLTAAQLGALGAIASAMFAVTGLSLPPATAVTTATVGPAVNVIVPESGRQYVKIPGPTWTDTLDSKAAFVRITGQCVDAAGNPAPADQGGTEVPLAGPIDALGDVVVPGAVRVTPPIIFDYNPAEYPPGTPNPFTYFRYKQYIMNRNATNTADWADPTKSVLQTTAWSGAASFKVNFGAMPAGLLKLTRSDPTTMGSGIVPDASGKPKLNTTNLANMVLNAGFEEDDKGWSLGPGASISSASAYTGTKSCTLNPFAGGGSSYVTEAVSHACHPSDNIYAEAYLASTTITAGYATLVAAFYDSAFAIISTPTGPNVVPPPGGQNWTRTSANFTAPVGASYVALQIYAPGGSAGEFWRVDSLWLNFQVSTGAGMGPDGLGGVKIIPGGVSPTELAAAAVTASKMAANAITAANAALAASSVVDSNVVTVGFNKVTYGTSIFAGDVILSRGVSQPVIVLANSGPLGSGLYLYGQADASTGATGLTSKPYVVVQSGGIGLYSGGNASVTITSSTMTFWSINGNSSAPYVAISTSGISIVNGANSVVIGASNVAITNGALSITSGTVTINIDATNFIKLHDSGTNTTGYLSAGYVALRVDSTSGLSALTYYNAGGPIHGVLLLQSSAGAQAIITSVTGVPGTPGTVNGYLFCLIGGAIRYIPFYA